jgi:DNA-binding transcriptional MocR family regulator
MNRGEIAVIEIRKRILSGEMKPGHRLKEKELCQLFGLSRTPVREALRRPETEGLDYDFAESRRLGVVELTKSDGSISTKYSSPRRRCRPARLYL